MFQEVKEIKLEISKYKSIIFSGNKIEKKNEKETTKAIYLICK